MSNKKELTHLVLWDSSDMDKTSLPYAKDNEKVLFLDMKGMDKVDEIVNYVREQTKDKIINSLVIIDHANAASQTLGDIKLSPSQLTQMLLNINLKFDKNSFIILHGCNIGNSFEFMDSVRDALHIDTYAIEGTAWSNYVPRIKKGEFTFEKEMTFNVPFINHNRVAYADKQGIYQSKHEIPFSIKDAEKVNLSDINAVEYPNRTVDKHKDVGELVPIKGEPISVLIEGDAIIEDQSLNTDNHILT